MEKIRECPFCGSTNIKVNEGDFFVTCVNCLAYGPGDGSDSNGYDFVMLNATNFYSRGGI